MNLININNLLTYCFVKVLLFCIEGYNQMNSIKKVPSSPLLNGEQLCHVPSKSNKQHLQDLQSQVNKSRIAIENMSQTKALDPHFYKKIEELQKELHHCILAINQQTDKNTTLTHVVNILKGQMNEVQALQRNQKEYQSNTFEKKIKKVQYDIKQILHKYNEEVAKINHLKEHASVARDERVVYSNLFNKIQKEIKHYQEIYKHNLIKDQIFLEKKKQNYPSKHIQNSDEILQQTMENFYQPPVSPNHSNHSKKLGTIKQIYRVKEAKLRQGKKSIKIIQSDMFLTNIKSSSKSSKTNLDVNSRKGKNKSFSQNILDKIYEKQAQIERILMSSECASLQDAIQYYSQIDNINDSLYQQVDNLQTKISMVEQEIERLQKQKRVSQVYQNGQITQFINISKKCRSNKHLVLDQSIHISQSTQIVLQICQLLKIGQNQQKIHLNDDVLKQIDSKISTFECMHFQRKGGRRQSKMVTLQESTFIGDRGVAELLQKIDRFNESEKIFDRTMLQMQYQKQIIRGRKKGKRSN